VLTTDVDKAYAILKDKIVTLEMPPGSAIHETTLAHELNLGRTPIREALKLLQAEQLVVTVPRRGMFVSSVTITDLHQIAEVRTELEGLAARLAAQRASEAEIDMIRSASEHIREALDQVPKEAIYTDRRLHSLIAEASHNTYLSTEVERFYNLSLRLWHLALSRIRTRDLDIQAHYDLIEAIVRHDASDAEEIMREHIRNFHRAIREAI